MRDPYWWIMGPVFLIIIGVGVYDVHQDNVHPPECVASSKVKSILQLRGRSADILLENGSRVDVNQANLYAGDTYCITWRRKP